MLSNRLVFVPVLVAGLLGPAGIAMAQDASAVSDAFAAAMSRGGEMEVKIGSASGGGDTVTLGEVSFVPKDGSTQTRFSQVELTGVAEAGDDFAADAITMTDGAMSGDTTGTIGKVMIGEASFPKKAAPDEKTRVSYRRMTGAEISLTPKERTEPLTISTFTMDVSDIVDGVPQASKGNAEAVTIPLSYFPAGGRITPSDLGYEETVFDVTWEGSRNAGSKALSLDEVSLTLRDGGTLTAKGDLGGIGGEAAATDPLGGLGTMSVADFTLVYEDNSLAGRVLEHFAKQQGMTREQYVDQLAAALPFMLGFLQNPEFQSKAAAALGTFLKDPRSLTVSLKPEAPVSGGQIVQLLSAAPQTIPDVLNATVTANQAE
ncbi:hypothetical protein [Afifella sp. IM 167]|uniref:hypothetical protein n=1 Tax=Afifella sp. IM 167 TaxID=2033586 RepID=UPI001CCFEDB8|nr:hypothetical protein [Afifella sp. IM 167]